MIFSLFSNTASFEIRRIHLGAVAFVFAVFSLIANPAVTAHANDSLNGSSPVVEADTLINVQEGSRATLVARVSVIQPELTTAYVDWGDGAPADLVVPSVDGTIIASHIYSVDGTYTVEVTVEDVFGESDSDTVQATVENVAPVISPHAPLTANLGDPNGLVVSPLVTDPGRDPITYDWDLDGDGVFGDSSRPTVIIDTTQVGTFTVSLTVSDDQGASSTSSFPVSITDLRAPTGASSLTVGDSGVRVELVARGSEALRPVRPGERVVLDARAVDITTNQLVPVHRLDITLNGSQLPSDTQVTKPQDGRMIAILPRDSVVADSQLRAAATAYDSNDEELASAQLVVNVLSELRVHISQVTQFVQPGRPVIYTAFTTDGVPPVSYRWSVDDFPTSTLTTSPNLVLNGSMILPGEQIELSVIATDSLGASGTAKIITNVPADDSADDSSPPIQTVNGGKVQGRAIIGQLVNLGTTSVVVLAKVGNDFQNVRIHVDPASTEISADMGVEAFTTGSKVVVVADKDVLSGDATALKVRAIQSESTRKHDRVVVSKPDAGDALILSSEDDPDETRTIKDIDRRFTTGDILVAIGRRGGARNHGGNSAVLVDTNDIRERLERYAQEKWSDGDASTSGLIDKLEAKRKQLEQERIDRAKKHKDELVRKAAEKAQEKARERAEQAANDPIRAIRSQAAADSEQQLIECASTVVGRPVTGEHDLTDEENVQVSAECIDDSNAGGFEGFERDGDQVTPPAEVLECILKVMGRIPNRPLTSTEENRLKEVCLPEGFDPAAHRSGDGQSPRQSDDALENRKKAYCLANVEDPRCENVNPENADGRQGPSTDQEKLEYCLANPSDERCAQINQIGIEPDRKKEGNSGRPEPSATPSGK